MTILLRANNAKQDIRVEGTFESVIADFSKKEGVEIHDCRIDENFKDKTIWINRINMSTIIHPDNEQ